MTARDVEISEGARANRRRHYEFAATTFAYHKCDGKLNVTLIVTFAIDRVKCCEMSTYSFESC